MAERQFQKDKSSKFLLWYQQGFSKLGQLVEGTICAKWAKTA